MKAVKPLVALCVLALLALGAYVLLSGQNQRDLHLTNAVAAPIEAVPGDVAVFVKIENHDGPDRLIGAYAPTAKATRIDGPAPTLAIPGDSAPSLAADGAFARLSGLPGTLADGQMIPITFEFEEAGKQSVQARLSAPRKTGEAHDFGLFGMGGVCRVGKGEPAPRIALTTRPDGDGWIIEVQAEEFEFTPDLADGLHVPGTGHGHLYLNGLKLQRLYANTARIGPLPPGRHEVLVTLNTNDHRAYVVGETPVTASATLTSD